VKELETKDEFDNQLTDAGNKLLVVDFTATWCPPCQTIKPKYHKLAEELGDTVVCVAVDVDVNKETSEDCGIEAMPTF